MKVAALLLPFLWTGFEYFRSELYHLKFAWLTPGCALLGWDQPELSWLGVYGIGFVVASMASAWLLVRPKAVFLAVAGLAIGGLALLGPPSGKPNEPGTLPIAGVQLEFPPESRILSSLDALHAGHPQAGLVVLSEYALAGPPPDSLKAWCRKTHCYLIVGGKDFISPSEYYDTGFVIGPAGEVVFRQGKSVPIPFFADGLPAPSQGIWNSPWGRIGICICYDASYTRVVDGLIRQGAQMIVVPAMDVFEWGRQEHLANGRVAPIRAAEYGVPVFRVASSGVSQAIDGQGRVLAQAEYPGPGDTLSAEVSLPAKGTLPMDRWLAPFCTALVALLLVVHLLWPWIKGITRYFIRANP
jgi:apolipoprotein N-acyltransferase